MLDYFICSKNPNIKGAPPSHSQGPWAIVQLLAGGQENSKIKQEPPSLSQGPWVIVQPLALAWRVRKSKN